jgi:hypothetical protein
MSKYRKKPVVIEAVQWTGHNGSRVGTFLEDGGADWAAVGDGIEIRTLEGTMRADPGDYVIRGVKGEHYPCKPDIFEATYESVTQHESTHEGSDVPA